MTVNPERETIVNFLEAEDTMQIYTCNRKWKNKLKKLGFEASDTDALGGELFELPRNYLQIRKPREMTPEQAEAGRERLRAAREAAGVGEFRPKTKKKAVAKKKAKPVVEEVEEEDEDLEDEDEEIEDEDIDDEDEDEDEEVVVVKRKRPATKATKSAPAKAPLKRGRPKK